MPKFVYNSLFQFGKDDTKYDLVSKEGISERNFGDKKLLLIEPQVISQLTERAFADVSHLLRSSHLEQLSLILKDNEASENDKFDLSFVISFFEVFSFVGALSLEANCKAKSVEGSVN